MTTTATYDSIIQ